MTRSGHGRCEGPGPRISTRFRHGDTYKVRILTYRTLGFCSHTLMFTSFNAPQSVRQLRLHGFGYITLPVVIVRTQLAPSHDYIRTHHLNCIRVRNLLIGYRCPRAFDKQVDVIRPLTLRRSSIILDLTGSLLC